MKRRTLYVENKKNKTDHEDLKTGFDLVPQQVNIKRSVRVYTGGGEYGSFGILSRTRRARVCCVSSVREK